MMKTSNHGEEEDSGLLAGNEPGARAASRAFVGCGRGRPRSREVSGRRRVACAMGVALLLSSCSLPLPEAVSDQTRFYVLTPAAAPASAEAATAATAARRVWVRSVFVPEFLRGKIMAVRLGGNEVRYVDFARWAEPLEPGLTRVLRENLGRAPGTVQVVGGAAEAHDYDVVVHLRQCEGVMPAGVARLAARVEVFSTEVDPKLVAQEDFTTEVPGWNGTDYAQLAAKLSEAAAALSDRVAALLPAAKM